MRILLPGAVETILNQLKAAGFEAYAVGGCVRDSILGRIPDDWDITTSARTDEVKGLFSRTVDTGIKHGTVTVMIGHIGYEVTTFRIDGDYEDGRHPKDVFYTDSLTQDLRRRDFTINAMAYSHDSGVVDEFGGIDDLRNGIIRCVGEPRERFAEDALRMLRAIRFAAQLNFTIDEATMEAIAELAPSISKVSEERIQVELTKTLLSPHPEQFIHAYKLGITAVILPEFDLMMQTEQNNPHHIFNVGEHTLHVIQEVPANKVMRYAAFFHDMCKPLVVSEDAQGINHFYNHAQKGYEECRVVMRRLKMDNDTIQAVSNLVLHHDIRIEPGTSSMRRAISRIGEDVFPAIFDLQRADILAQSMYIRESKLSRLEQNRADYAEVQRNGQCTSLKKLAVKGTDLIVAGIEPGAVMGEVLQRMLDDVIAVPEHNEKAYLLGHLTEFTRG